MARHEVVSPASSFPAGGGRGGRATTSSSCYVLWILSQWALIATLILYARRGATFARESSAGPIGTGMLLGMLGLAIVWLVELPFRARRRTGGRGATTSTDVDYLDVARSRTGTLLGAPFFSRLPRAPRS